MRFFFDLKNEFETLLDYRGEDFRDHNSAFDFAKAIAQDMTHRTTMRWFGWSVEVWDEVGRQLTSVSIGAVEAS